MPLVATVTSLVSSANKHAAAMNIRKQMYCKYRNTDST